MSNYYSKHELKLRWQLQENFIFGELHIYLSGFI